MVSLANVQRIANIFFIYVFVIFAMLSTASAMQDKERVLNEDHLVVRLF